MFFSSPTTLFYFCKTSKLSAQFGFIAGISTLEQTQSPSKFFFFLSIILPSQPGLTKTVILSWTSPFSVPASPQCFAWIFIASFASSHVYSHLLVQALAFTKSSESEERQAMGGQEALTMGLACDSELWKILSLSGKSYSKIMEQHQ